MQSINNLSLSSNEIFCEEFCEDSAIYYIVYFIKNKIQFTHSLASWASPITLGPGSGAATLHHGKFKVIYRVIMGDS